MQEESGEMIFNLFQRANHLRSAVMHPGVCLTSWWGNTAILKTDDKKVMIKRYIGLEGCAMCEGIQDKRHHCPISSPESYPHRFARSSDPGCQNISTCHSAKGAWLYLKRYSCFYFTTTSSTSTFWPFVVYGYISVICQESYLLLIQPSGGVNYSGAEYCKRKVLFRQTGAGRG